MPPFVTTLYELASRQHGVIASHQARRLSSRQQLSREFRSERWLKEASGVYRAAGSARTPDSEAMQRLLRAGPGAVISHHSTLALFDLPGLGLSPLHITRMRASNGVKVRADGIVPHESRRLPPHHITVHRGFPTVTPSRALADTARREPTGRLERWLDWMWNRRLITYASMVEVVNDLHNRGRPELAKIAHILRRRGPEYVAPASGLESRTNSLLRTADLPGVQRQVNLGGVDWLARVDFKLDGLPLILEVQSDTYHASLSAQRDDELRFAALRAESFSVLPLLESQVWHAPDAVVEAVQLAIADLTR